MTILNQLNNKQKEAAAHVHGPLLILAGAGSGKTRTITFRMAHMVLELGIRPQEILAVSFTNEAATEMKERMEKLVTPKIARLMTLSTFHALGTKILKEQIQHLGYHGRFSIYDTSDQLSVLRELLGKFKGDKSYDRKSLLQKISMLKNKGINPSNFTESPFFDPEDPNDIVLEHLYGQYQDQLKFFNAIDFDDILLLSVKLLNEFPHIVEHYSKQFRYIMVDEYQDTNPLQFQLIRHLTQYHQNICVVGDDDQSIYSFRGANIKNILNFEDHFSSAKVIKLEENYRSTTPILALANHVIQENKNRHAKLLWTQNIGKNQPLLWQCADTDHEAQMVVDQVKKIIQSGEKASTIAIIYRSNTQAQPLEEALRANQIDYRLFGGQKFYEKKEVKDLIAYLSVLNNISDELSFRRILSTPPKGIGMMTLTKFIELAKEKKCCLYKAFEQSSYLAGPRALNVNEFTSLLNRIRSASREGTLLGVANIIETLIKELDFNKYIDESYKNPNQSLRRKKDLEILVSSATRYDSSVEGKQKGLTGFLERILLSDISNREDAIEDDQVAEEDSNKVNLMTMHSSKGLEYEHVVIVGVEEDILPHKRTLKDILGEVEEERRLFYVGITRAKKSLILTYCKERTLYGVKVKRNKTRFLFNVNSDLLKEENCSHFEHLAEQEKNDYKKNFFNSILLSLNQ